MNQHDFTTGTCPCGVTRAAYEADQTIPGECRFAMDGLVSVAVGDRLRAGLTASVREPTSRDSVTGHICGITAPWQEDAPAAALAVGGIPIPTPTVQAAVDANIRDMECNSWGEPWTPGILFAVNPVVNRAVTALEVAQGIIRDTILPNLSPAERLNLLEDLLCIVCGECGELLPPGSGVCKCLKR